MFYRNYVHKSNVVGAGILAFIAGAAVWALFGKKITDEVSTNPDFKRLKRQVMNKASQIKDISQEKYDQIVEEVTDAYSRARGISQKELADLVTDLKMHWSKIKNAWNEGGDSA